RQQDGPRARMTDGRSHTDQRRPMFQRTVLAVVAVLPSVLKKPLLRWFFGFRIGDRVQIGIAYFDCNQLTIEDDARIGHGVAFVRTGSVRVGSRALIGPFNVFRGGTRIDIDSYAEFLRF